jgi:hypothetical protein
MEQFTTKQLLDEVLRRVLDAESITKIEAATHSCFPDRTDVFYKTKAGRMSESRINLHELYERTKSHKLVDLGLSKNNF